MKILIDMQSLQGLSSKRGIGRYSWGIFQAIARNAGNHEVFALLNLSLESTYQEAFDMISTVIPSSNILSFSTFTHSGEISIENKWIAIASESIRSKYIEDFGFDAVLNTSIFDGAEDSTAVGIPKSSKVVYASIVYDLIPLTDTGKYLGSENSINWYFRKIKTLKRSDLLLTISQFTKDDYNDQISNGCSNIINISSAINFQESRPLIIDIEKAYKKYSITKPFILHVGAWEQRKNFEGLIKAFANLPVEVRQNHQLVLVGPLGLTGADSLKSIIRREGLNDGDVICTDFISDVDLNCLYVSAKLFVFPSFQEGFGFPILEAMQYAVPVIASGLTSIPEVIGIKDALFDPYSTSSISNLTLRALTDEKYRDKLIDNSKARVEQFSWDKSAKLAISSIQSAVEEKNKTNKFYSFEQCISDASLYGVSNKSDLAELSRLITKNDCSIEIMHSSAERRKQLSWRVEGPFDSTYSLALLNRETARALTALGHKVVLHSTEGHGDFDASSEFLDKNPDLKDMHALVQSHPHKSVDVVSRNLYPPRVADMHSRINMLHHYAWEEAGFPAEWVDYFNSSLTAMTTLSSHVQKVMIDNGVNIPMRVSGCGVDHWERVVSDQTYKIKAKSFRFLHVSSCIPRKGVDALLAAYGEAFSSDDDVELVIKTFNNIHNKVQQQIMEHTNNNPKYPMVQVIEGDISDSQLKSLYEQCQVLVSACKAEGFGLPFAEAMLSGLPVITTNWGGQLDFCNSANSWLVDYEFQKADTHFNLYSSTWANPHLVALTDAMRKAFNAPDEKRREMAENGRRILLNEFKWINVAARTVNVIAEIEDIKVPECNICWITTWNTKCGIATYSQHLISNMPVSNVEIYAPVNQAKIDANDNSVRNWVLGKEYNNLENIADDIELSKRNVIMIQFNYGFFNHSELSNFILAQSKLGRKIFIELHATWDHGNSRNHNLKFIIDALRVCTRIFVHSVDDLNNMKSIGLVDNVCIFPHGMIDVNEEYSPISERVVATYGFCLPHKGLLETVQAIKLLNQNDYPVKLKMINSKYPVEKSSHLAEQLRSIIHNDGLAEFIEFDDRFHSDEDCISLLRKSSLVVFPYQDTGESASGAIRYGMASGVPVAVTPIPIFAELKGAVHELQGIDIKSIAQGIKNTLESISSDSEGSNSIRNNAKEWRKQHSYRMLGIRLLNIYKSTLINIAGSII